MVKHHNLTDVNVILIAETMKAIGVKETEDSAMIWLPKSQIEYPDEASPGAVIEVTLPEWLAKEKGLI